MEPGGLLARCIENFQKFDFQIKHEAGKNFPHAEFLSKVPQTEEEVKVCDQVNQVITEDKNIWSLGLGKSVEELVDHQRMQPNLLYCET